jgi:aspartyl-tRNA(Asn)/glutamyl-tRNA(Gln) amidotransferase subunit A
VSGGNDLHYLSIRELGRRIERREVSPLEVTRSSLARLEAHESALNAFITVMADEALSEAERAERSIMKGGYLGPLHGVPIGLKDLYQTRGVRTTGGSRALADWVPEEDSTVTERLRRAGAIVIGKNNLHEFAFGPTSENPHYGNTNNPWDTTRIPGGSSGGSAASVAAGICWASMGSDTGGSVRLPAALCNLVGLKPTYGRVSRYGVIPLAWSMDHCGPLTRTVDDTAIVMNAISGHDHRDPASVDRVTPDFSAILDGRVDGLRIGVLREQFGAQIDPEVQAANRTALETLRGLGAQVEEVSVPLAEQAMPASTVVLLSEAAAVHERWLAKHRDQYGKLILLRLDAAATLTAVQYLKAQRARRALQHAFADLFQRVDLVASPTTPILAPTFDEVSTEGLRGGLVQLTRLFNLLGLPAVSVPCGFSDGGLPIGLQLVGRPWDEQTVLRAAHAYEQHTNWASRHPFD